MAGKVSINQTSVVSSLPPARLQQDSALLTQKGNRNNYTDYLSAMLMLGGSALTHIEEIQGYASASIKGYSEYFLELKKTGSFEKASSKFLSVTDPLYETIREKAQKTSHGSILGKEKDLLEMSTTGMYLHSVGILPEMVSQSLSMVINYSAIELTRRCVKPEMDFYSFALEEDKDPSLRLFKSARQIALLAAFTAMPGGGLALVTTGSISALGVVGNRLLEVGEKKETSGKVFTLADALLDIKLMNDCLDSTFNSRMISFVTPILLGSKLISKTYDNFDTTNDGLSSFAVGTKVKYASLASDPTALIRAIGHGCVVTGSMLDLFDASPSGIGKNRALLANLAGLREEAIRKQGLEDANSLSAQENSSDLKLPIRSRRVEVVGQDAKGNFIERIGNKQARFYLSDFSVLINPSQELRAAGCFSQEIDRRVKDYGETATREYLRSLEALSDYSVADETQVGAKGKIFLRSKLSKQLYSDVREAVNSFVDKSLPHISTQQYAQILDWNINRVEKAISIHETTHIRRKDSEEHPAWMIANDFLEFDNNIINDLPNIKLGFVLYNGKLRIVLDSEINKMKSQGAIAMRDFANRPEAFNAIVLPILAGDAFYNDSVYKNAAMKSGDVGFDKTSTMLIYKLDPSDQYSDFIESFKELSLDTRDQLLKDKQFANSLRSAVIFELIESREKNALSLLRNLGLNPEEIKEIYKQCIKDVIFRSKPDYKWWSIQRRIGIIEAIESIGMKAILDETTFAPALLLGEIKEVINDSLKELFRMNLFASLSLHLEDLVDRKTKTTSLDALHLHDLSYMIDIPVEYRDIDKYANAVKNLIDRNLDKKLKPKLESAGFQSGQIKKIYFWVHGSAVRIDQNEIERIKNLADEVSIAEDTAIIITPWIREKDFNLLQAFEYYIDGQSISKADYAAYLISYSKLINYITEKCGNKLLVWEEQFADFKDRETVAAIFNYFNIASSNITFNCFGQLPEECLAEQIRLCSYLVGVKNILGGEVSPKPFPRIAQNIITPADSFANRNKRVINMLRPEKYKEYENEFGLLDLSNGIHRVVNIGAGFYPYDTIELSEVLSLYGNSNLKLATTELVSVPNKAYIFFEIPKQSTLMLDIINHVDRKAGSGVSMKLDYETKELVLIADRSNNVVSLAIRAYVIDDFKEEGLMLVDTVSDISVQQFGGIDEDFGVHTLVQRAIDAFGGNEKIAELLLQNADLVCDKYSVSHFPVKTAIEKVGANYLEISSVADLKNDSISLLTMFNVTVHMSSAQKQVMFQHLSNKLKANGLLIQLNMFDIKGFKKEKGKLIQVFNFGLPQPRRYDDGDDRY